MSSQWDLSVDFLCVGSGLGGCAAAATAASAGLDTLIVEKTPLLGGTTAYSYGILWVPGNYLQEQAGLQDSIADARDYMHFLGAGRESVQHVEAYLQHA